MPRRAAPLASTPHAEFITCSLQCKLGATIAELITPNALCAMEGIRSCSRMLYPYPPTSATLARIMTSHTTLTTPFGGIHAFEDRCRYHCFRGLCCHKNSNRKHERSAYRGTALASTARHTHACQQCSYRSHRAATGLSCRSHSHILRSFKWAPGLLLFLLRTTHAEDRISGPTIYLGIVTHQ